MTGAGGSRVGQVPETLCARCGHRVALHVRAPGSAGTAEPGRVLCSALVHLTMGGDRLCGCSLV